MAEIRHKTPSTLFTAAHPLNVKVKKERVKLLPLYLLFNDMAVEEIDFFSSFRSFSSLSISHSEKQTIQYQ